jgi:hypothetical protein
MIKSHPADTREIEIEISLDRVKRNKIMIPSFARCTPLVWVVGSLVRRSGRRMVLCSREGDRQWLVAHSFCRASLRSFATFERLKCGCPGSPRRIPLSALCLTYEDDPSKTILGSEF